MAFEHIPERILAHTSDRPVEEARAHSAIRFHDGRNPRGVAPRRNWFCQAQMRLEMMENSPELAGRFEDEAGVARQFPDQLFNFVFQNDNLFRAKSDFPLALLAPDFRPVEGSRSHVGG